MIVIVPLTSFQSSSAWKLVLSKPVEIGYFNAFTERNDEIGVEANTEKWPHLCLFFT